MKITKKKINWEELGWIDLFKGAFFIAIGYEAGSWLMHMAMQIFVNILS